MPIPSSERIVFQRHPIREVICQLRYPTILRLKTEPPAEFQERVQEDYPDYEEVVETVPGQLGEVLRQAGLVPKTETNHRFWNEERTRSITVSTDFIALSNKDYRGWSAFLGEILQAQQALQQVYRPSSYKRVGLRYINVINRHEFGVEEEPWRELLNPELLGIAGSEVADDLQQTQSESTIRLQEIDEAYVTLRHGIILEDSGTSVFLVDSDFYTTAQCKEADLEQILNSFHEHAGNLVRWWYADRFRAVLGAY